MRCDTAHPKVFFVIRMCCEKMVLLLSQSDHCLAPLPMEKLRIATVALQVRFEDEVTPRAKPEILPLPPPR